MDTRATVHKGNIIVHKTGWAALAAATACAITALTFTALHIRRAERRLKIEIAVRRVESRMPDTGTQCPTTDRTAADEIDTAA